MHGSNLAGGNSLLTNRKDSTNTDEYIAQDTLYRRKLKHLVL